jgi:hypothetical protein
LARVASEGLRPAWEGAGPPAGAAACCSWEVLEQPVRNIGRERAAKDAEEALTKFLRESLILFISVLLLECCYKDINYKPYFIIFKLAKWN